MFCKKNQVMVLFKGKYLIMNKYLLLLLPVFLLAVFLFGLTPVKAQYGLDETVSKTSYSKNDTPESVTTTIINTALYLVYFVFFILVLYAGIRWMTAQGNEEHVTKAKNILEAAIIGLAVISMAYAITNFVLGKVGAGKVTEEVNSGINPGVPTANTCTIKPGTSVSTICNPKLQAECLSSACEWNGMAVAPAFKCTGQLENFSSMCASMGTEGPCIALPWCMWN